MSSLSLPYSSAPSTAAPLSRPIKYGLLFLPYVSSLALSGDALTSYGVAWAGSWFILVASMSGWVKPLPTDRPVTHQLLRPIFLVQLVFAGFFCLSSIFYVWDLLSVPQEWMAVADTDLSLVAEAQRYYVLGHAAFTTGLLAGMRCNQETQWELTTSLSFPVFLLVGALVSYALHVVLGSLPGLNQFAVKFQAMAAIALVLSFAVSVIRSRGGLAVLTGLVYSIILVEGLLSGWKHRVIAVLGLLIVFLFPRYTKTSSVVGIATLVFVLTVLPAYNQTFRELNWNRGVNAETAALASVQQLTSGETDVSEQSWAFLTNRTTEISLFVDYLEHTPDKNPYYGFSIAEQAVLSVLPRVFWPGKPNTEEMVMERVFENGAVMRYSGASAKPQIVVDAYLSFGGVGVFITCLLLGLLFSWTSWLAESHLGGYRFGTAVVYTSLFSTAILTNSFEFFANTFFWSMITMVGVFFGLWVTGWLAPVRPTDEVPEPAASTASA